MASNKDFRVKEVFIDTMESVSCAWKWLLCTEDTVTGQNEQRLMAENFRHPYIYNYCVFKSYTTYLVKLQNNQFWVSVIPFSRFDEILNRKQ